MSIKSRVSEVFIFSGMFLQSVSFVVRRTGRRLMGHEGVQIEAVADVIRQESTRTTLRYIGESLNHQGSALEAVRIALVQRAKGLQEVPIMNMSGIRVGPTGSVPTGMTR